MQWISRTTAAATLLGAMLFGQAPQASRSCVVADSGESTVGEAQIGTALHRMRIRADREEMHRILRAVDDSAQRFELDPVMILAVIHVESRFDTRAVSSKGAMGLMQLRPSTAREVASNLELDWSGAEQLFDPDFNILLGSCYLRSLMDRFEDRDTALAAYHAGPTRVSQLRRTTGIVPRRYPEKVTAAFDRLTSL